MAIIKIAENIYYVGVDDLKTKFFEGTWPIPNGISYNTYVIQDKKVVLIEGGVSESHTREYMDLLRMVVDPSKIDIIVVNHTEPDHTGTLPILYNVAPNAKIIVSAMGKIFLKNIYGIEDEERIVTVKDGENIDIGERELKFFTTPGVHWPDSMVTYETKDKILFSSDIFGTFGALNGKIFDDEIDIDFYIEEGKRYFTNIVGKFCRPAQTALKKLSGIEIKIIAPAHGPVWRTKKEKIIELYDKLSKYETENKVLIIYGTMYGYTEQAIKILTRKLTEKDIKTNTINVTLTHPSYVLADAWDSKVIVIGAPTYDGSAFLPMHSTILYIAEKMLKNKYYAIIGNYGWSGKGYKKLTERLDKLEWKLVEPIIEIKGRTTQKDIEAINQLAENITKTIHI